MPGRSTKSLRVFCRVCGAIRTRRSQLSSAPGVLCQRDEEDCHAFEETFCPSGCRQLHSLVRRHYADEILAAFRIEDEARIGLLGTRLSLQQHTRLVLPGFFLRT